MRNKIGMSDTVSRMVNEIELELDAVFFSVDVESTDVLNENTRIILGEMLPETFGFENNVIYVSIGSEKVNLFRVITDYEYSSNGNPTITPKYSKLYPLGKVKELHEKFSYMEVKQLLDELK